MTTHELKTHPEFFGPVSRGEKPFEIRKNDRDFHLGDTLVLREYDPFDGYSGNQVEATVTYLTSYEQRLGYVVMGIALAAAPTPPVTGSADGNLEPGPAMPNGLIGGRNVNNRLTTLEEASINVNRLYGLLKGRLDGIDEDHTELAGQVRQLTAIIERHHELLTPQLMHPAPPQPAADDTGDGNGWREVYDEFVRSIAGESQRWFDMSSQMAIDDNNMWTAAMQAAVNKAIELGLVPRVNPDDAAQIRVVARQLEKIWHDPPVPESAYCANCKAHAKRILTALANLNGADQ